ncbi:MAG: PEP-CTERM sorting domain-containing protein [Candidatus Marinimicrobia bacterium]|nr:PEP-CTERM sorting domain-containing protein [Candidatus Neomarinimicrobiota bacterium]
MRVAVSSATVVVAVMGLLFMGPTVRASIIDFESTQAAHPNLLHHWTFEGASVATALEDKKGAGSLAGTGTLNLISGFGGSGQAMQFPTGDNYARSTTYPGGASWVNQATVQFLIRPTADVSGVAVGVVADHVSGGMNRFDFAQNGTDSFTWVRGDLAFKPVFGTGTSVALTLGNWYYVALQYEYYDSGGGDMKFRLNSWVLDLTANPSGGTLAHTLNNEIVNSSSTGATLSNRGLGFAVHPATITTGWDGELDAVAIYNTTLSSATLQEHVDVIPEPTAGLLFALAGLLLGLLRRRRL